MAADVNIMAALDLSLESITDGSGNMKKLSRMLGDASSEGFKYGAKSLNRDVAAVQTLLKAGMVDAGKDLMQRTKDLKALADKSNTDIKDLNDKIAKTNDVALRKELKQRRNAVISLLDDQKQAHAEWVETEIEGAERRAAILERADKRAKMSSFEVLQKVGQTTTEMTENIADALSSGSIDPQSLSKGLSQGLASGLDVAGGAMVRKGGSIGKIGAALTAASGAMLAAAGAITAIVGVFAAAYGQTKDLNAEIAAGGNAFNLMTVGAGNLSDSLEQVRHASQTMGLQMRMDTKEIIGAMNEFHNAGTSLTNLTGFVEGNANAFEKLTQVTTTAILASKGLGIEVSDFAGFAEQFRKMGYGLNDVEGAFGMISHEARKAGVTTKSFFTAINEASSGMAMYNFRVGDTVGLFSDLVKILGEDLAQERLGLEKRFGNMGFQDRFQNTLTTGKGVSQAIVKADAIAQAEAFGKTFQGIGGLDQFGGAANIDVASLGNLNEKAFQELLNGIKGSDDEQTNLARQQLQSLYTLSKGVDGNTSAVALSLGGLSKQGELAMELASGQALLGGRSLAEAASDPVARMLLEEQLGMSGEQLEQNVRIERALKAEYEEMKKNGDVEGDFYEALASGQLSETMTLAEAAKTQYSMLEQMGRQQLIETQSIGVEIKNNIGVILEKIYGIISYFVGKDDDTKALQDLHRVSQEIAIGNERIAEETSNLNKLQTKLASTKEVQERTEIQADIDAQKTLIGNLTSNLKGSIEAQKVLSTGASGKDARAADFESRSGGRSVGDVIGGMSAKEKTRLGLGTTIYKAADTGSPDQQRWAYEYLKEIGGDLDRLNELSEQQKALVERELDLTTGQYVESNNSASTLQTVAEQQLRVEEIRRKEDEEKRKADEAAQKKQQQLAEKQLDEMKKQEFQKIIEGIGGNKSRAEITKILQTQGTKGVLDLINASGATDAQKSTARSTLGAAYDDFIYRGNGVNGTINPIDKNDEFFGAKPGGAIDKAVRGGGSPINITINGIKDADGVARAVASTLKKMGYGNARTYSN